MICPKCSTEMQQTYEPYEERCPKCGYWFDTWTGKEKVMDLDKLPLGGEEPIDWDGDPCFHCGSDKTIRIDIISIDPTVWHCECGVCGKGFEAIGSREGRQEE